MNRFTYQGGPLYFGGTPDIPTPQPPPPTLQQPNIDAAGAKQMQSAMGAKGPSSTIRTGPAGLADPGTGSLAQKSLLG